MFRWVVEGYRRSRDGYTSQAGMAKVFQDDLSEDPHDGQYILLRIRLFREGASVESRKETKESQYSWTLMIEGGTWLLMKIQRVRYSLGSKLLLAFVDLTDSMNTIPRGIEGNDALALMAV